MSPMTNLLIAHGPGAAEVGILAIVGKAVISLAAGGCAFLLLPLLSALAPRGKASGTQQRASRTWGIVMGALVAAAGALVAIRVWQALD